MSITDRFHCIIYIDTVFIQIEAAPQIVLHKRNSSHPRGCGHDRKWAVPACWGKTMAEDSLGLFLPQHGSFFDYHILII